MKQKFYSEREAAENFGINRLTIRKYRSLGKLDPIRIKNTLLYSLEELENFKEWFISERR